MKSTSHQPYESVGQRIRIARERRRLTQRALAKQIGVSYQLIQRYERGHSVSVDRLAQIAAVLGVALDWLYSAASKSSHKVLLG